MRFALILCMLLILAAPARAEWSGLDYTLAGTFLTLHLVDRAQTIRALEDGGEELNPILGSNPTRAELDRFIFLTGAGVLWFAHWAGDEKRPYVLGLAAAIKAAVVYRHHSFGLEVHF